MTRHGDPGVTIAATVPLGNVPTWAVLERRLFDVLDSAWGQFENAFCDADGRLVYDGDMHDRDGVDDFYEPFFNWPVLYQLGGSADILTASKKHWEAITQQMTDVGFVIDEFELGYDWFHMGESLNFFYAICAADPLDERFKARAKRFADLYLGDSPSGNYDPSRKMIVAPHTGAGGPRWGLGNDWARYSASQTGMQQYGLPLDDLAGIRSWSDLESPENATLMGEAMRNRMGRGDTAINLAATSLVTNAWLYDNEERYAEWVAEYVSAWRERATSNDGLIPDNVGPSGSVGELHHGNFFGGHYGWQWPHGFYSIEAAVMAAAINESLVSGNVDGLDIARAPISTVLAHSAELDKVSTRGSLSKGWVEKLSLDESAIVSLVPYRIGNNGWFDYQPLPLVYPLWLWWLSNASGDRELLDYLQAHSGFDWAKVRAFQDKEEQGHEAPWMSFLMGQNPDYPANAFELALAQVNRRLALIASYEGLPIGDDIHWWQRLNPIVTEALVQLISGAPPTIYNGGLQMARVRFADYVTGKPGLPNEVAALVDGFDEGSVDVQILNLSVDKAQDLVVQAGAYGEDRIDGVYFDVADSNYPGAFTSYEIPSVLSSVKRVADVSSPRIRVTLPAATKIRLRLSVSRRAYPPSHAAFTKPEPTQTRKS